MPSGKRGKAKEICRRLPGSGSDCSYQPRETDFSGISPALGGELVLEHSSLWKLAFPDHLLFHSLPIATSGATWLPPQGPGSLKTLLDSLATEELEVSYLL